MQLILWISFQALIATYICGRVIDPDLWWHVAVGRWIVGNGAIPHQDYWNLSGVGLPWRAYSWSNEIVYALVDSWWGLRGLLFLQILLTFAIVFTSAFCLSKLAKDWFFGGLISAVAVTGTYGHLTLRPQSLTWIFFVLTIYLASKVSSEGPRPKTLVLIALTMMAWANTHITTSLGVIVALAWCVAWDKKESWRANLPKVFLACLVGMVATPYLGGELVTFVSKVSHPFKYTSIIEFQPANLQQYPTGILVCLSVVLLSFLHLQPRIIGVPKLLAGAGFAIAGFGIIKFLPQALFIVAALICEIWSKSVDGSSTKKGSAALLGALGEGFERLKGVALKIPPEGLSFVFLALAAVNIYPLWKEPTNSSVVPIKAVDFIESNKLPKPILAPFGDGGYLMYRYTDKNGKPEFLVAIDGRTNVTSEWFLEKHTDALNGRVNWREIVEKANPKTILWRNQSPLVAILLNNIEWCGIYNDGDRESGYSIFVRREFYETISDKLPSHNCSIGVKGGSDKYFRVELE